MVKNCYKTIIGLLICVSFFAGAYSFVQAEIDYEKNYTDQERRELMDMYIEENSLGTELIDYDLIWEYMKIGNWQPGATHPFNPNPPDPNPPAQPPSSLDPGPPPPKLYGDDGDDVENGVWDMVYRAVNFVFGFISIVAVGMIIYGAFMWMMSAGDPQKTKLAQGTITWSVIGLIFFIIMRLLLNYIFGIFGIHFVGLS